MRTGLMVVAVAVGLAVPSVGHAEDAAAVEGGACGVMLTHDNAIALQPIADKLMAVVSGPIEGSQDLGSRRESVGTVRGIATKMRCAYSLFASKELATAEAFVARAEKWSVAQDARLAAEETARTNIIVPLCEATWALDSAKADMAREKANPSGVHDLRVLHSAGSAAQSAQDWIAALKPQYATYRKHAYTGWRSEGACVAASK